MTLRLGWFTTARGPGSRAMYEAVAGAIAAGELGAEFAFVFCNREHGENETTDGFFDLVEANGHPLVAQSSVGYRRSAGGERSRPGEPLPPWRIEYDRRVDEALRERDFDIGVLAGYMLIFEREFVAGHSLLNLHPALPDGPTGTWRDVIRQLIRSRAGESGVMLHLAIAEVDLGPVAAYCRYPLRDAALAPLWTAIESSIDTLDDAALEESALFHAIRERGVGHEAPLLLATLGEFAAGRLHARHGRVSDAAGAAARPGDLTHLVRERLATASH